MAEGEKKPAPVGNQETGNVGPAAAPRGRGWLIGIGLTLAAMIALVIAYFGTLSDIEPDGSQRASTARPLAAAEFVGSGACADCHADEYQHWAASQHAVAMQLAKEATVLGDFADTEFTHQGVTSRFFRRQGAFFVRTDGPDGTLADFQVVHTFGIYPLQQYLVELPGGHVQALPIAWDARPAEAGGQRWFHVYPDETIDHEDELHWTGRQQNWNYMCADCHSTHVKKNYDAASDSYSTSWSEISVGCEACHGPGSNHVQLARAAADTGAATPQLGLTVDLSERRTATWAIDPDSGLATRSHPRESDAELDVCAQCHARRGQFSDGYLPGDPFEDHYRPALLEDPLYYPDGQQRDEVYKWGSFLSSRMYAKGVTCSDCHDPHSQQLRAEGNAVCAQCHLASKFDTPAHHFHERGTPGGACKSCHMKTETYMVIDPRHDHSFRIPRPDLTTAFGVPNACTQCHGRDGEFFADIAAQEISKRYEQPKPGYQNFVDAFEPADRGDPSAAYPLLQVAADPNQSAIARASAFARLARQPSREAMVVATSALEDSSALIRRSALEVIERLPPPSRKAALPLLSDPVRSVRMQAARTLAPLADDAIGAGNLAAFEKAASEYVAAEAFNADRPEARTNLAGFLAMRNKFEQSEAQYRAALELEPAYVPAWTNLADLKRMQGQESEAEKTLREALAIAPENAALHHSLGLSLVRQRRNEEAMPELERAVELAPQDTRFAYVLAVGQYSVGRKNEAIETLERALLITPADGAILSALASYHSDAGNRATALRYAQEILELYPNDPNAAELVRSLQDPQ